MASRLRIGTRGSKLALFQANALVAALKEHAPSVQTEIIEIKTSGDWDPSHGETRLSEAEGGKGLFAKEIEQALMRDDIDCGVHSMKDMDSNLPDGLVIDHMLPREDARDAFLANDHMTLGDLPAGATVGTSSVRRQAFIMAKRPDVKIVPLRGNVPTRIEKLRSWKVDATILAYAGLKRLGLEGEASSVIDPRDMLPAAGQGAIGIETRQNDKAIRMLLDRVHCRVTGFCVKAERAALRVLDGSCHTPIGAHATMSGEKMRLQVVVCSPDGRQNYAGTGDDRIDSDVQAEKLGADVGNDLKRRVPKDILVA